MRPVYLLVAACILGLVVGAAILADQVTKHIVSSQLALDDSIHVLGPFSIHHVQNSGIAFGLFSDSSSALSFGLMIFFALAGVTIVCVLLWKNPRSAVRAGTGLAFILGGAVSNVADRLVRGSVIDFLDFYIGSYHWPAFNAADSAIVVGSGLLLLELFAGRLPNWNLGSTSAESR